jgi:hypothetical protein
MILNLLEVSVMTFFFNDFNPQILPSYLVVS